METHFCVSLLCHIWGGNQGRGLGQLSLSQRRTAPARNSVYTCSVLLTGVFSFCSQQSSSYQSSNIVDLITEAMSLCQAGICLFYLRPRSINQPPVPVQLLHPVTKSLPSLVELTSSAVRRHFRRQNVDRLPVSADARDFIKQQVFAN